MELDTLLEHYFGAADTDSVAPDTIQDGLDRLRIDFGVERSPERRFALWALLATMDAAPAPDLAFDDPAMRDAARAFGDARWDAERGR